MKYSVNGGSVSQLVVICASEFVLRSFRINDRFYFDVAQTARDDALTNAAVFE
jgi:hypothetical protein